MHTGDSVGWLRAWAVKPQSHAHEPIQGLCAVIKEEPPHLAVVTGLNLDWAEQAGIRLVIVGVVVDALFTLKSCSIRSEGADRNTRTAAKLRALLKENDGSTVLSGADPCCQAAPSPAHDNHIEQFLHNPVLAQ